MSSWNVETVESVYAAFGRGEFPEEVFLENVEWHTDPELPRPMAHHGRDEVAAYFKQWIGAWARFGAEPLELIPRPGEQIVAVVAMGPTVSAGGERAQVAHLWTLHRQRVRRVRVFGSKEDALEAAAEPMPPRRAGPSLADRVWSDVREYRGPADESLVSFVRELDPATEALDLGCGDARLTVELRAKRMTAADVSLVALKRARRRLPAATVVLLEPGTPLPFEREAFDLILCADAVQEVQDVALLVSELKRTLKPGGTLAITAPAFGRRSGLRAVRRGWGEVFDPRSPDIRFYTRDSLGELLDFAGFNQVEVASKDGRLLATARL
jgi:SAM-dependent methyltransferase